MILYLALFQLNMQIKVPLITFKIFVEDPSNACKE